MLKPTRAFFGFVTLVFFLTALPVSSALLVKNYGNSLLKGPLSFSAGALSLLKDLFYFRKNASENRRLKNTLSEWRLKQFAQGELVQENARLVKLLNLKQSSSLPFNRVLFSRVIGRAPAAWNRALLIDKGTRQGVRPNLLVMADASLAGKVIETGPGVSKVLLITDPNSKIAVLVERTRQTGILYGTAAGECRMKYISVDAELRPGDVVETAGVGGFFPKGLVVGSVNRCWKEPGQMYQVASVKPMTDLGQIEEVALVE